MVAPTPEFTPVQSYILPGTNERLYVALNILNVDMQSKTFHAVISAYTLDKAQQTVFDVQEHQGQLQAAPAPLQALANGLLDNADPIDNRPGNSTIDNRPGNSTIDEAAAPDTALSVDARGLTEEQLGEAAAKLKRVMEEFTDGLSKASVHVDTPKT